MLSEAKDLINCLGDYVLFLKESYLWILFDKRYKVIDGLDIWIDEFCCTKDVENFSLKYHICIHSKGKCLNSVKIVGSLKGVN